MIICNSLYCISSCLDLNLASSYKVLLSWYMTILLRIFFNKFCRFFFRKAIWIVEMLSRKRILKVFMFRNVNKFHSGMVYLSSRSVVQYGHKSKMVTVESLKKIWGINWMVHVHKNHGLLNRVNAHCSLLRYPLCFSP